MTTTATRPLRSLDLKTTLARIITEVFAPVVLVIALLFVVAIHETGSLTRGLYYGGIASIFAGVIPYSIVLVGVRLGKLSDRHVFQRAERPVMMALALISVTVGLWVMQLLDVPPGLFALVTAMVTGLGATLVITLWWKISIHAAVASGSATVIIFQFGGIGAWTIVVMAVVVAVVGWSRVHLRRHSTAQVVAGALTGLAVTALVYFIA